MSGKTKTLEASNLLRAADHLGVRPIWLAEGLGPMRPEGYITNPLVTVDTAAEPPATLSVTPTTRGQARLLLDQVPDHLLGDAIDYMQWLIDRHKKTTDAARGGRTLPRRAQG